MVLWYKESDGIIYAIYSMVCHDNLFSVRMIMSYSYDIKRVIGSGIYIWYGMWYVMCGERWYYDI